MLTKNMDLCASTNIKHIHYIWATGLHMTCSAIQIMQTAVYRVGSHYLQGDLYWCKGKVEHLLQVTHHDAPLGMCKIRAEVLIRFYWQLLHISLALVLINISQTQNLCLKFNELHCCLRKKAEGILAHSFKAVTLFPAEGAPPVRHVICNYQPVILRKILFVHRTRFSYCVLMY